MTGLSGVLVTEVWTGPQVGLMSWGGGHCSDSVERTIRYSSAVHHMIER